MPLSSDKGAQNTKYAVGGLGSFLAMSMEFLPKGFLQMIYVDTAFDKQHYKFEYVRQEFLGEVRCLVFDITPVKQNDRGRFEGRLWVEDQGFHIVRFNGAYEHPSKANYFFHFDSWRVFAGDNQWLPAYIYCEETNLRYGVARKLMFKAQTRLWGYDLNLVRVRREQELNKILVESRTPVKDQADENHDYSPIQEQRLWERQAEDNVADRMEKLGVLAPAGDVDKVLVTVVNNLIVTNNLDIEPEVRCRVLMTSTLESFDIGHTIVLSRGLIDVLPDEASLATILAMELSHIVLGHRIDTQYAFYDRMLWDDQDTFRHFGFARTPEEENAANTKAVELLANSPYKSQLAAARQFVQVLQTRSKEIPNLISAHLGDRVPTTWSGSDSLTATQTSATGAPATECRRVKGDLRRLASGRTAQVRSLERRSGTLEGQTRGHGGGARENALRDHSVHSVSHTRQDCAGYDRERSTQRRQVRQPRTPLR